MWLTRARTVAKTTESVGSPQLMIFWECGVVKALVSKTLLLEVSTSVLGFCSSGIDYSINCHGCDRSFAMCLCALRLKSIRGVVFRPL